jgi:hypothetical protein
MNLNTVVGISQLKYTTARYDEIHRTDILLHFCRDELGLTPEKWQELKESGSTMVEGPQLEGTDRGRFFLWYFVNYIIDYVPEDY